jgi:hypothetical protein
MSNTYNRGKQWLMENDFLAVGEAGELFMMIVGAGFFFDQNTDNTYADIVGEIVTSGYVAGGVAIPNVEIQGSGATRFMVGTRVHYGVLGSVFINAAVIYENIGAGSPPPAGSILIQLIQLSNLTIPTSSYSIRFASNVDPAKFLTYQD